VGKRWGEGGKGVEGTTRAGEGTSVPQPSFGSQIPIAFYQLNVAVASFISRASLSPCTGHVAFGDGNMNMATINLFGTL